MKGITRIFSNLSDFFLGKTDDIPIFEERRPTSIYTRLRYLSEKYPEHESLMGFCEEVNQMIGLLERKNTFDSGAFINFCKRIFHEEIDLYEVESMLGEVNTDVHTLYKDTINRKAFEQTLFFSKLEERLARLIPDLYKPVHIISAMERISQAEKEGFHSPEFCSTLTKLLLRLNNNDKLPYEEIETFFNTFVPDSYFHHNMAILLHAPDDPQLRVLDGFPRIFFIRQELEDMISHDMPLFKKVAKPEPEKEVLENLQASENGNSIESATSIRNFLIGNNNKKALSQLVSLSANQDELKQEAMKVKAAYESLANQHMRGLISFAKHSKLSWLWTSWVLDLLERLDGGTSSSAELPIED